ncbi:HNH endonuclease [Paraburkholderia phenoliruptrix]|uniref:HNH endonuclease n=1 Tax=Paraburkholderia phenoliruptrix TaxID=252970 RepID=UPI00285EBDAC|nr:HNH endonuclease [Paraburkholderia phenoliruptrix]MDR6389161.1 hypothetical protein [Paraburkholderia phenoliruptrix]
MEIKLGGGGVAIVDAEDYERLSKIKWHLTPGGRAHGHVHKTPEGWGYTALMHRFILGLMKGDPREVDHINGNPLDNRKANLRICTRVENCRNMGISSRNKCGFKGVVLNKLRGRYQSKIVVHGKRIHLGYFDTAEEAHAAYCRAATELYGEFANFGKSTPLKDQS